MTRTHIITADGTEFEEVNAKAARRRKVISRIAGGTALLVTSLVLSAAVIGFHRAAIEGAPDENKIADYNDGWTDGLGDLLDRDPALSDACLARAKDGDALHTCLDDDNAPKGIDIKKGEAACAPASEGSRQDCLALYLRGAWANDNSFTPAGPVLVKECTDQYQGAELDDCFTQEIG